MWRQLGIRRVIPIELDTLVVDLRRMRPTSRRASLTVQLMLTWFPDAELAIRGG